MAVVYERASLLEQVAAASGLARPFAVASIRRACTRSGVDPDRMSRSELRRALSDIRQVLEIYLNGPEVVEHMKEIEALLAA